MRFQIFVYVWLVVGLACAGSDADTLRLSREAPAVYQEKLAGRLTTLEAAKADLPARQGETTGGVVLVRETLHYLHDDGKRLLVEHQILQPTSQAGVESAARFVTGCRKTGQKLHLIEARTITADGKYLTVQPDAAFLQTPQRDADESLYNDYIELVVIFPDVKPGCQTEVTVVIETDQPRIPGHFTAEENFAFYWPAGQIRTEVDLPAAMAPQLNYHALGTGVPEMVLKEADGRVNLSWIRKSTPELHYEAVRQPISQTGPCLFLTTLKSWDEFLSWYAPQVLEHNALSDPLTEAVSKATEGVSSPRTILDRLLAKVSLEVRYVGLEFGRCDLVPHNPSEVWKNQYGDCKDKANLLRTMLETKGIKSHLALVNTDHVGRIEKRSPDYREFTHVILAVEEAPGQYLFCDPTVPGLPAGQLGPGSVNREVLLVKSQGPAEWVTTPALSAGTLRYDFDASIDSSGAWSGWLKFGATHYFASNYLRLEAESNHEQRLKRMANVLSPISNAVRTIDLKILEHQAENDYATEVYFVIPGSGGSLRFPCDPSLFPNLGDGEDRTTTYPLWNEGFTVSARLKLPPGWHPDVLPKPHVATSAYGAGSASWSYADGIMKAEMQWKIKRSPLPATDAQAFATTVNAFKAWLDTPIKLVASEVDPKARIAADPLEDFARMPTGEGQLALLNERYPTTGDHLLRRAALQKTSQMFSDDRATVFQAGIDLANLDLDEDKNDQALERLETMLAGGRESLEVNVFAAAEHFKALALFRLDRPDEAVALWQRLADDLSLNETRRGFAYYRLGSMAAEKQPEHALNQLRLGLKLHSGAEHLLYQELAVLLLRQHQEEAWRSELKGLADQKPNHLAYTLESLAYRVSSLPAEDKLIADQLLKSLQDLGDPRAVSQAFASELGAAAGYRESLLVGKRIQEELRAFVKENVTAIPAVEIPAVLDTDEKLSAAAEECNTNVRDPHVATRYGLERLVRLVRFEPGVNFHAVVYRTTAFAEWWWRNESQKSRVKNPAAALLEKLLDCCEQFPPQVNTPLDGAILRADWLMQQDKPGEARIVLDKLLALPELPEHYVVSANFERGRVMEALQSPKEAGESYAALEPFVGRLSAAISGVHRGVLLNLWQGDYDAALEKCALLRQIDNDKLLGSSDAPKDLRELLAFSKDEESARSFWKASAEWWPKWLVIARKLHPEPLNEKRIIVSMIKDVLAYGTEIGTARQADDPKKLAALIDGLMAAARWSPELLLEAQSIMILLPTFQTKVSKMKCYALARELAEKVPQTRPDLKRRSLMVSAAVHSEEMNAAAVIDCAREFRDIPSDLDQVSLVMARLFASAALFKQSELTLALREVEACLREEVEDANPEMTANVLVSLYEVMDDSVIQPELLTMLGAQAKVRDNARMQARMKKLLDRAKASAIPEGLHLAMADWINKARPIWWDLCGPKDLADASDQKLAERLQQDDPDSFDIEKWKLSILTLAEEKRGPALRRTAFGVFMRHCHLLAGTEPDARELVKWFWDSEHLNLKCRSANFAANVLPIALYLPALWGEWKSSPAAREWAESAPEYFQAVEEYFASGPHQPAPLLKLATQCLPIKTAQPTSLWAVGQLAILGQLNAVKTLQRQSKRQAGVAPVIVAAIARHVERMESLLPLRTEMEALSQEYLASASAVGDANGARWIASDLQFLTRAAAAQMRLGQARQQPAPMEDWFWLDVFDLHRTGLSLNQRANVARTILAKQPEKSPLFQIHVVATLLDIDDAEERRTAQEILNRYPSAFISYLYHVELRSKEHPDILAPFRSTGKKRTQSEPLLLALNALVAHEDADGLKWLLEQQPNALTKLPMKLSYAIDKLLGRGPDLAALRTETARQLAVGLARRSPGILFGTFDSMDAMDLAEMITPEMEARLLAIIPSDHVSLIQLRLLQKRFDAALELTEAALKENPTRYHLQWLKSQASVGLNRRPEAFVALQIYLNYSGDEADHAAARKLYEELQKAP